MTPCVVCWNSSLGWQANHNNNVSWFNTAFIEHDISHSLDFHCLQTVEAGPELNASLATHYSHTDSHTLTLGIPLQASATPLGSLARWGSLWLSVLHGPNSLSGTQSTKRRNNRGEVHYNSSLYHGSVKGSHLSKVTTLPCPIVSCAVEPVTV